jgi:hypothetical protein
MFHETPTQVPEDDTDHFNPEPQQLDPNPPHPSITGPLGVPTPMDEYILAEDRQDHKAMARAMLKFTEDWGAGFNINVRGVLLRLIRGKKASDVNPIAMMTFRWNAGLEAENIVAHFRLPIPNGQRCLMWDYYYSLERRQQRVPNFYTNYSSAFRFIADGPSTPEYKDTEGYPFHRFLQYLATAVALVGLTPERQDDLLRLISDYALKERTFLSIL